MLEVSNVRRNSSVNNLPVRRNSSINNLPVANGAHIVALDPFALATDAVSNDNASRRRPSNVGSTAGSVPLRADRLAMLGEQHKDENMRRMSSCSNISDRSDRRSGAVRTAALSIRGALKSPVPGTDRDTSKSPVPPQDHLQGDPGSQGGRRLSSVGGGRRLSSVGMGRRLSSVGAESHGEVLPRSSTSSPSPWTTHVPGVNNNRRSTVINTTAGRMKRHSPCAMPSVLAQEVHDSAHSHRGTLLVVPGSEYSTATNTAANSPRGSTYEIPSSRNSVQSHASVKGMMSQHPSRFQSTRASLLEALDEDAVTEGTDLNDNLRNSQGGDGGQQQQERQQHSRLDEVRVTTFTFSKELTERLAKSKAKKARNRMLRARGKAGLAAVQDALDVAAEKVVSKPSSGRSSPGLSQPWTRRATLFSSNQSRVTDDESDHNVVDEQRSDPDEDTEEKAEVYDANNGTEEEAEDDEDPPQVERLMRGSPQDVMRKSVWTRPRDMGKLQAVYRSTKQQLTRAKEEEPPGTFKANFQKIAGAVQASFHTVNTAKALVSIFQDLRADASRLNTVVEQDEDLSSKLMPSRKVDWHGKAILTVRIIAARGLASLDPLPNPYVMVALGSTKYYTQTASQQTDPVWDHMCQNRQFSFMVRPEDHGVLQMSVHSEHPNKEDIYLGHVDVSVPSHASADWITQRAKLIYDAQDVPQAGVHVENQSELEFQLKMEDENSFSEVKERPPAKQCRKHTGVDSSAPSEPSSLTPSSQQCQRRQKLREHTPIEKRIARKSRLEHQRASIHQIIREKLNMKSSVAVPGPSESIVANQLIPQPSRIVSPVGSSTEAVGSPTHTPTLSVLNLSLEDVPKEVDKVIDRMQELRACFEDRLDHVDQIDDAADDVSDNANELFTQLHLEPISLQNGRRHRTANPNQKAGHVEDPPNFWDTDKYGEECDPFDMPPPAGDEQAEDVQRQYQRTSVGMFLSEEDGGIRLTLDARGAVQLVTEDLTFLASKRDQEVSMAQADMAEMHIFQAELKELLHALEELLQQKLTGIRELISVDVIGNEEDTEVLQGSRHDQLQISLKNAKVAQRKLRACPRKADSEQKADHLQKADNRLQFQSSCRRYSASAGAAFSFEIHPITPTLKQGAHSCKKSPTGSLRQHQHGSPRQHHHVKVNHQSKMSSKHSGGNMRLKQTLQSLKLAAFQEGDVDPDDWQSMEWDCPPWELSSTLKKGGWPRALASPLQKLAMLRKRTRAPSAVNRLQRRMPCGPVVTSESQQSLANIVPSGFSTTPSARAGSNSSEGAPRVRLSQFLSAQSSSPSLMSWVADGSASSAGDASTGQLGAWDVSWSQAHVKRGVSGWVFLKPVNVDDDSSLGTGRLSSTSADPSTWGFSRDTSVSNIYLPPASALNSPGPKHIHMKTAQELDEMEELESLMEQSALYYLSTVKLQRPRTGPAMTSSGLNAPPPANRKLVTR